jgi:hypothetical protein
MRLKLLAGPARVFALAALLAAAPAARAAYTVTFSQVGANVFASGGGTIDINGLTPESSGGGPSFVTAALADEGTGSGSFDQYLSAVSGPSTFGPGGFNFTNTGTGDFVAILGTASRIEVTEGYVSGALLRDTATYTGQTFETLGLTPGVYVYDINSGANADTFTVKIGGSIPESSTWAMLLVGFRGLAWARLRGWRFTSL